MIRNYGCLRNRVKGLGLALTLLALPLTAAATESTDRQQQMQDTFQYEVDRFADIQVLRYKVPGFAGLSLQQKILAYYLSQAALAGRDIIWDQNYKYNLQIRRTLEAVYQNYAGDRTSEEFEKFLVYVKRVWFANGIHHHYSNDKFIPGFSEEFFRKIVRETDAAFPVMPGESKEDLLNRICPSVFDPAVAPKKVSLDASEDMVLASAVNFYEGVTQAEAESWFEAQPQEDDERPVSTGLNSRLVKNQDGTVTEEVYKAGGLYSGAIVKITGWLAKAAAVAETGVQKKALEKLIEYYHTGDLKKFDEYNILWVQDTESVVDAINGFIETYNDPLGHTGSWESVVSIKDLDLTRKFGILSDKAAWFEDQSPVDPAHKRDEVVGVSYKIINVVMEAGDSSPASPIGINLPNSNWIRSGYGSKSVSLGNIEDAYDGASTGGRTAEFYLPEIRSLIQKYGDIAGKLHTGLHEVIGHASGKILDGVGSPGETLKNYASTLEEARADLVALYFMGDQFLVDLGLSPSTEIMKAEYTRYITNGLMVQLARLDEGKDLEEAHMRNRHMISSWVLEKGLQNAVVEPRVVEGKTYFVVNDYLKLRELFGTLLREVQRIKSEGDYAAGKELVEKYGVEVDPRLHKEVKKRWASLNLAPYSGFINPMLTPVYGAKGEINDIKLNYLSSFSAQMLYYAGHASFLPSVPEAPWM